ncbi:MAG: hypothetical protein AAGU27_15600 [Dehalobacterium sp.]
MISIDFLARYLTSASIFFALWAVYTFIRQMLNERSVMVKLFPKKTLRLAGIGLLLCFISQWLKTI